MQRDALFELLDQAPATTCVITSNRRLVRSLGTAFDNWQARRGRRVWETPLLLPFGSFVARLYDVAQHDPALTGGPAPLSATQERGIWQQVIADSGVGLLPSATAAALASEAWSAAHQWSIAARIEHYRFGADVRAFYRWSNEYRRRVEAAGATDFARLPQLVVEHLQSGRLDAPDTIVLAGFAEATPQQQAVFDALAARGSTCVHYAPPRHRASVRKAPTLDRHDEDVRMADWVAARLMADPAARIGIVVPQLEQRRRALATALDAALVPHDLLAPNEQRPYTISLGGRLIDVPLIAFFLRAIRLAVMPVTVEEASAVLRSPYLSGVQRARDSIDRLDAALRGISATTVALESLHDAAQGVARDGALDGAFDVAHVLENFRVLINWRRTAIARPHKPSEWAESIAALTHSISNDAQRMLDSSEFQALLRWRELLSEFAELDRVTVRLDASNAVDRLHALARDVIFQPEAGDPPVQVLGLLEANDQTFDHVWIMGMTADAWPSPSQPNALLPMELQRAAGMPGTDAALDLQRSKRRLNDLLQSAPEVVVSYAANDGDRPLTASTLVASIDSLLDLVQSQRVVDRIAPVRLDAFNDSMAPRWLGGPLRGGASVVRDQAACPFRAFAAHRLDARALERPHDGFDRRERGTLVHDVLARFWSALQTPTRDGLASMARDQRRQLLQASAATAQRHLQRRWGHKSAVLTDLESARVIEVIDAWLQYEIDERQPFRVVAIESARAITLGPLTFTARLDRVDESADGRRIVLDYKTGGSKTTGWLDARPEEPQLPLYLTASEPTAQAIGLARVRAGDIGFTAYASDGALLPGRGQYWSNTHPSWDALVASWEEVLHRLAEQFASGDAAVDPKRAYSTCRYCELPTLCRVNERGGVVVTDLDEEDDSQWSNDDD